MNIRLPRPVEEALRRLEERGYPSYAVGGCVRDQVLGMTPHDYDICTAALPARMEEVFRGERVIETGVQHGTLTVLLEGMAIEITTFRLDGDYLDGRHPATVQFTDQVEQDLSRRDFTINAMAYSPLRGMQDPFGGQEDCRAGVIRCVGEPEKRFHEDALRILRALRFSARLGFPIEARTAQAAWDGRDMLARISRERIAAELTGLLIGEKAGDTLAAFPEVLCAAAPLRALTESPDWPLTTRRIDCAPREPLVRWAALLADLGGDRARTVLKGLKMPTKTIDAVGALADFSGQALSSAPVQEWLMRLGPRGLDRFIDLQAAAQAARQPERREQILDRARQIRTEADRLVRENACCTLGQLAVNGRDMADAGFRGKQIGEALNALLLQVVRGRLPNHRDALMAAAEKMLKESMG